MLEVFDLNLPVEYSIREIVSPSSLSLKSTFKEQPDEKMSVLPRGLWHSKKSKQSFKSTMLNGIGQDYVIMFKRQQ